MADTAITEDPKFYSLGRDLANTEKSVRDKAVATIRRDIIKLTECTDLEMMKLWKGLFYTFWMSDKPPIQEELANVLSAMLFEFRTEELSWKYITCFWKTMIREWGGIDVFRMDKYLYLLRRFINQTFEFLDQKLWRQDLVEQYQSLVETEIYNKVYLGLFSQYCECFLEELHDQIPHISSYDFMSLIRPFFNILCLDSSPIVINGIRGRVFELLLSDYETLRDKGDSKDRPMFDKVDLRFIHDVFYDYTFNKKDLSPVYRKNFGALELMYEEAVNERFETPEAPELKEPTRKPAEKRVATVEKKNTSKPKKERTTKKVKKVAGKGSKK